MRAASVCLLAVLLAPGCIEAMLGGCPPQAGVWAEATLEAEPTDTNITILTQALAEMAFASVQDAPPKDLRGPIILSVEDDAFVVTVYPQKFRWDEADGAWYNLSGPMEIRYEPVEGRREFDIGDDFRAWADEEAARLLPVFAGLHDELMQRTGWNGTPVTEAIRTVVQC